MQKAYFEEKTGKIQLNHYVLDNTIRNHNQQGKKRRGQTAKVIKYFDELYLCNHIMMNSK